MFDVAEIILK